MLDLNKTTSTSAHSGIPTSPGSNAVNLSQASSSAEASVSDVPESAAAGRSPFRFLKPVPYLLALLTVAVLAKNIIPGLDPVVSTALTLIIGTSSIASMLLLMMTHMTIIFRVSPTSGTAASSSSTSTTSGSSSSDLLNAVATVAIIDALTD